MKRSGVVLLVGALVVLGGGGMYAYRAVDKARATPDTMYRTQAVGKGRLVGRVTATGTLSALVTVQVGSQVSGRIAELSADFNTTVKKGQVIAKLDPQLFQAALAQAQANALSARANEVKAKAQVLEAERQFERTKALHAQGLATKADLDSIETNASVARAQVDVARAASEQARAAMSQASVNLSYTTIVSPIDGVVISRNVDVGQTVAASLQAPVLFTIAEDLRKMQVITKVAEGDVGRLAAGMAAFFTVDAYPGQRFKGTIQQIRNAATTVQNVVTYDAVIVVDNPDQKLRPGMTANVTVVYAERDDVVTVPNAALRFRPPAAGSASSSAAASGAAPAGRPQRPSPDGPRTVWVLAGGAPQAREVKTGLSDGTSTEVTDGDLKPGEPVIVELQQEGDKKPPAGAPPQGGSNPFRRVF